MNASSSKKSLSRCRLPPLILHPFTPYQFLFALSSLPTNSLGNNIEEVPPSLEQTTKEQEQAKKMAL